MAVSAMNELLKIVMEKGASDIHLKVGRPPLLRVRGDLVPLEGAASFSDDQVRDAVYSVLNSDQRARLEAERELDFSFQVPGVARFRGNAFFQRDHPGAVFRFIPALIPTLEALGLPPVLKEQIDNAIELSEKSLM